MFPAPGNAAPSLDAFADAQDRKRRLIGSDIVFYWAPVVTFPVEVPLSPETGRPFDPVQASAGSATQASATVRCGAFFKAVNRGGAANADIATPIGRNERTRVFLNTASADGLTLTASGGVTEFEFHGNRFDVYAIKWDEIVLGYKRLLVYGAEKGNSQ